MYEINLRSKELKEILHSFEEERKMDEEEVIQIMTEAFTNSYRKQIDAPEAQVRVEVTPEGVMRIFHDFDVVADDSENIDETLDIKEKDAQALRAGAKVGETVTMPVDLSVLGRAAVVQAKNMIKQHSKEQEKQRVYEEFYDKTYELITGVVKTVDQKVVFVDLNNITLGVLPKKEQIPGEEYRPGSIVKTIIKEVKKETKGSQVILSRADAKFVERLFEREVSEIAKGEIEIKAIARVPGERTKMAVYSHKAGVDAVASCIGSQGSRIREVRGEINSLLDPKDGLENIDVFNWDDDLGELVKNALAPAEIRAVFYADDQEEASYKARPLMVVVDNDQLSLAIGKQGKNARLAVKLANRKIDIKTLEQANELGIDIDGKVEEFKLDQERLAKEREEKEMLARQKEIEKRQEEFNAQLAASDTGFDEEAIEEMEDFLDEEENNFVEEEVEEAVEEVEEETAEVVEEVVEEEKEKTKKKKVDLTPKTTYVSKFEEFADANRSEDKPAETKKKKRKDDENERRLRAEELDTDKEYEIKPEYTQEELDEIAAQLEEEENDSWINEDIDFDEYDSYYDDDEG